MTKPKKKLSKVEKLAKDRQRKKEKYESIKNDPELYALQKEKERKRYLLRKEKKTICSIKDMTPRAQREQRKKWRKNSTNYLVRKKERQRIEKIIVDNSPPPSDQEKETVEAADPLLPGNLRESTRPSANAKLLIRRLRYRHMKTVKQLKTQINKLKNEIKDIKKDKEQKNFEEKERITVDDSVEKRVNEMIIEVKTERVDEIKKKLLFGESISKSLKQEYQTLDKKYKKPFMDKIIRNRNQLKKYKVLGKIPFPYRKKSQKSKEVNVLSNKIKLFLEDDANSSLAPGKKEFIKSGGVQKQKRYLRDSLGNLYEKFCNEEIKIGYSTFCRYRPCWIVTPKTRDTCGCKLHTNVDLLMTALKKATITKEGSGTDVLKSICCNRTDEKCLDRKCQRCQYKVLEYKEFCNDEKIVYFQWTTEKQTYKARNGKEMITTVTVKKKLEDYPRNIIINFEDSILPKFLMHTKNIAMQYASIKELKENLKQDEILIHIDFSENYCLKHNTEIQSFHFGASRGQVSLHTGVLYYLNSETKLNATQSFCTVSKCVQHDAASIWAHLKPVLEMAKELVPALKVINFLSDSPTSQYRNKYIFYMMTKLTETVSSIERITWNYLEAGHGKGAPDGIGAVVKRTADNFVKHGGDVGSFDKFVEIVSQNIRNVKINVIEDDTILNTKFPKNIPTFKGTMNVHQVLWCLTLPHTVSFRKLSCFVCQSSYIPCSHNKHLGVLSIAIDSRSTCSSYEVETTESNPQNRINSIPDEEHYSVSEVENDTVVLNDRNNLLNNANSVSQSTENDSSNLNIGLQTNNLLNNEVLVLPPTDNDTNYFNIDSPTICNNISNIDDTALLNEIDDQAFLNDSKASSPPPIRSISPKVKILANVPFDWQRYTFQKKKSTVFYQGGQEEFKKFISNTATESPSVKLVSMDIDNAEKSLINQSEEFDDSGRVEIEALVMTGCDSNKENIKDPQCQEHNIGDWVIVQYQIKSKLYAYIGKITEYSNGTCTINFLKKSSNKSNMFFWPTVKDEDSIAESRILFTLLMPTINRRGQYIFDNLPNLNYR